MTIGRKVGAADRVGTGLNRVQEAVREPPVDRSVLNARLSQETSRDDSMAPTRSCPDHPVSFAPGHPTSLAPNLRPASMQVQRSAGTFATILRTSNPRRWSRITPCRVANRDQRHGPSRAPAAPYAASRTRRSSAASSFV